MNKIVELTIKGILQSLKGVIKEQLSADQLDLPSVLIVAVMLSTAPAYSTQYGIPQAVNNDLT